MIRPEHIATAWHSVADEWIVRRNKMHDRDQWEVVHNSCPDLISDDTMKVVGRYAYQQDAEDEALQLENKARGQAVLNMLHNVKEQS